MKKKLILVASPPASGKTYVSERLANTIEHLVYLDKDDLAPLMRAAFHAAGEAFDMDGDFYRSNLRSAEYATIIHLAFSTLRFEKYVLVNAPFGKEIRNIAYIKTLKERANALDAQLLLIWISTPAELCYERMKQRNLDRDAKKLEDWESYVKMINYTPPYELEEAGAVDQFLVFDTKDDAAWRHSFDLALQLIDK